MPPNQSLSFKERFLYGALGAAAPEVIRWSKIALRPADSDLPSSWAIYLTALLVFVIFGGLFATFWKDDSPLKCFYFGATFPAFVSAILGSPPPLPK